MTTEQTALQRLKEVCEKATPEVWEEEWRQIPECDGYEVSSFGNVRSYYKHGHFKEKRTQYPRPISLANNRGYRTACVKRGETYRTRSVHKLVMEAFIGPCPEGQEVAHLNGVRHDNRLSNLSYVTHRENESHKIAHGTLGIGEKNSFSTLQGWQVAEIKYLAEKSVPHNKIADLFDVPCKYVAEILRGKVWGHQSQRIDYAATTAVEAARARLEDVCPTK